MEAIFKSFDVDDDEMITDLNLKNAFTKLGKDISEDELKHIFQQHDTNRDGKLSLAEFEHMLVGICHKERDDSQLLEKW